MSLSLSFRWSEELLARVDRARGFESRSSWVRRAVERALSDAKEPVAREQADPGFVPLKGAESSEGVRSAAPAQELSAIELAEARRRALAGAYRPPKK